MIELIFEEVPAPGGTTGDSGHDLYIALQKLPGTEYDYTNDWLYVDVTELIKNTRMFLFHNDVHIWGEEPEVAVQGR